MVTYQVLPSEVFETAHVDVVPHLKAVLLLEKSGL